MRNDISNTGDIEEFQESIAGEITANSQLSIAIEINDTIDTSFQYSRNEQFNAFNDNDIANNENDEFITSIDNINRQNIA
jgi:hypothetical protein